MIFKKNKPRHMILLISLVLILTFAVGGTLAYIATQTGSVVNTFTPASTGTRVDEEFNGEIKEHVKITNIGEIPIYVRAKIIFSWKDNDSNVSSDPVRPDDYKITGSLGDGWIKGIDGYYYYIESIKPTESTTYLIERCEALTKKEGYNLSVEIITQSIQAQPTTAVNDAWGVSVDNNNQLIVAPSDNQSIEP